MAIFSRVTGPFKEFGLWAGLLFVLDRLLRGLSPRTGLYVYEMMDQPVSGKPLLGASLTKNLQYAEIGPGHPDLAQMPAREQVKRARFEQGARCLGAYRKGVLIGYVWLSYGSYQEDEVRCNYVLALPEQSVFDFDLFVLPEHRMGIAFMAIWHGANQFLHGQGVRHTFSRMTRFNLASRRAHARLGARCVGRVLVLKLGLTELLLATVSPYVRLTWRSDQRVPLRLAPAPGAGGGAPLPAEVTASKLTSGPQGSARP